MCTIDQKTDILFITRVVVINMHYYYLKMVVSARPRESDVHPISPKTPAPQYQPIDRKKRKGKRVEDFSRLVEIEQLRSIKKHLPCS